MDSVPVWVLTAVIEVSGLCVGTLGFLTFVFWRRQRRLQATVRQLQGGHVLPVTVAEPLPMAPAPAPLPEAATPVESPTPVPAVAETAVSAVAEEPVTTATDSAMVAPEATPVEAQEPAAEASATPLAEATTEASPGSAVLTQEMLDALLSGALQEDGAAEAQEETQSEAQQSVAAMMAENTTMEQQLNELQEKNSLLRQSVEQLLANASLPLEQQQDIPVPEKTMQEIERGLTALQQTRERAMQHLQAHCQLLGLADLEIRPDSPASGAPVAPNADGQVPQTSLQEEVRHLQTTLAQRTVDYQRVQDEYERLLVEYQRVFENAAAALPQASDAPTSQAA